MVTVYLQALISGILIGEFFSDFRWIDPDVWGDENQKFCSWGFPYCWDVFRFFCYTLLGIDPYLAALLGLPLFFGIGWIIQKFLIRPVLYAPETIKILVTVGIYFVSKTSLYFSSVQIFKQCRSHMGPTQLNFLEPVSASHVLQPQLLRLLW